MKLSLIKTQKAPAAVGPYSQGIIAGNMIFTSGQLALVPETGELITGDIQKATRQSLDNVKAILAEAGATFENVVKVTIFVTDINQFSTINEIYAEYFTNHKPARSLVEVSNLPKGGEIEIEAIASL